MVRLDKLTVGFDPASTALIVVDMVNAFVEKNAPLETPAAREMLPRLQKTIARSREADVEIIYLKPENRQGGADAGNLATITPQVLEGLFSDTEIHEEIQPQEGDVIIGKHRYSGFFQTELDSVLDTLTSRPSLSRGRRLTSAVTRRCAELFSGGTRSSRLRT